MELLHEKTFPSDSTEAKVVAVLKTCYDPEIPVDIFALGLIYDIEVVSAELNVEASDSQDVHVTMTLTSPACPVAGTLPPEIEHKIKSHVPGIATALVEVVWDPPWTIDMMTEGAKLELGMM